MTECSGRTATGPKNPLIVIPIFNERISVCKVLNELFRHYGGAVLAVDDGSTDGTAEKLARFPMVQVIRHATNLGYGRSLLDGFQHAIRLGHDVVVTMDCDEQHEPAQVPQFLQRLAQTDADIISGSRYLQKATAAELQIVPPERRHINSLVTNLLNTLCGWQLTDAFCGFKAYRVDALRRLELDEDGYGFPLQLWLQAWQAGLRIEELAVPLIYKPNFERSFGNGLDDAGTRLRYYLRVIGRELERFDRLNAVPESACNCRE